MKYENGTGAMTTANSKKKKKKKYKNLVEGGVS